MTDEFEGASYIAALDKKTATEWTLITLALVSVAWWVFILVYYFATRS